MCINQKLLLLMLNLFCLYNVQAEKIVVRPIVLEDVKGLVELDRVVSFEYFKPLFLQYPGSPLAEDPDGILEQELVSDEKLFYQAAQGDAHCQVYVALANDKRVGFGIFTQASKDITIDLLCVIQAYRNCGVGKAIVKMIREISGVTNYRVAIINKNEQAVRFWKSLGFQRIDKPDDMGNDYPADCDHIYDYYKLTL